MKIVRQYSGSESIPFWNIIDAIKDKSIREDIYTIATQLQTLENEVLKQIEKSLYLENKK